MGDADCLVFLGGCDRSGTTIVSRVLGERLSLVVLPEAYFHAVAYRRHGPEVDAATATAHWRSRSWDVHRHPRPPDGTSLTAFLRQAMTRIHDERRGPSTNLRVVECTPENVEIGSLLLGQFPDSWFVHLVRDPRAVTASLLAADFGPKRPQECARLWKQRVASGLALEQRHPDRVVRVRYEDVMAGEDPGLDTLVEVVPADPEHRWVAARDHLLDPTSIDLQPRAACAIDPGRAEHWRDDLPDEAVAAVEYECRELMGLFGYEPVGVSDGRGSTVRRVDTARSIANELTWTSLRRSLRWARVRASRR